MKQFTEDLGFLREYKSEFNLLSNQDLDLIERYQSNTLSYKKEDYTESNFSYDNGALFLNDEKLIYEEYASGKHIYNFDITGLTEISPIKKEVLRAFEISKRLTIVNKDENTMLVVEIKPYAVTVLGQYCIDCEIPEYKILLEKTKI